MSKYTAQYFIDKFSAIPSKKWTTEVLEGENGTRCAMGHCGWREGRALFRLFRTLSLHVTVVNDEKVGRYTQRLPRQRILAALRDIRAGELK